MMNDNKIIKAWEKLLSTGDAPVGKHWSVGGIVTTQLAKETFDMLNRQKAKINGLQDEVVIKTDMLNKQKAEMERYLHSIKLLEKDVQAAKFECIKEVAEKVDYLIGTTPSVPNRAYRKISKDIKNLVKEMVGDDK